MFTPPNARYKVCSRECTLAAHAAKMKAQPPRPRKSYEPIPEKKCGYCGEILPAANFHVRSQHSSGLSYACRKCAAAYSAHYAQENRVEYLARRKAWYDRNREAAATDAQERYWKNYGRNREYAWRNAHGIELSWDDYLALRETQDAKCGICQRSEGDLAKNLAVDHDHETGRIRGLLCDDCNIAIGRFKDSPELLRRALNYLKE